MGSSGVCCSDSPLATRGNIRSATAMSTAPTKPPTHPAINPLASDFCFTVATFVLLIVCHPQLLAADRSILVRCRVSGAKEGAEKVDAGRKQRPQGLKPR